MKPLHIIPFLLFTTLTTAQQVQFCHQRAIRKSDICLALTTSPNSTTGDIDLNLHISARLPEQGKGWVGFGVGMKMDHSLMFSMYPGAKEGTVTVSVRTTKNHLPPSEVLFHPDILIKKSWISNGLINALLTCHSCHSWSGTVLDTASHKQNWIWATNPRQPIASDNTDLWLNQHVDFGHAVFDMAASFSKEGELPLVTEERLNSTSVVGDYGDEEEEEDKHHKHSPFGLASIHGFLLATAFLVLSAGAVVIRSGFEKGFKLHWVVQGSAGGVIVLGCLMGILLSFRHGSKFRSLHQLIGLLVLPSVIAQGFLGYAHHLQYKKTESRNVYSRLHVWIGRVLLVIGNVNVGLGLRLSHASWFKFFVWILSLGIQLAALLPMWYFWSKGRTVLDIVRNQKCGANNEGYESVDPGAFIVDEELYDEEREYELNERENVSGESTPKKDEFGQ